VIFALVPAATDAQDRIAMIRELIKIGRSAAGMHLIAFVACLFLPAPFANAQELVPVLDVSREQRARDMRFCLAMAEGRLSGGSQQYSVLGIFDDLKKYVLKDKPTGGFLYTTLMSRRTDPVANDSGNPQRRETLFGSDSSDIRSDRYVMCLLASGYQWKGDSRAYVEELRDLANQGIAPAQAGLALTFQSYKFGASRMDHSEFVSWTIKAAEQGYAIAQFNLSYAYSRGEGVERNDEKALNWMIAAAKNGYGRAQSIFQQKEQIQAEIETRLKDVAGLDSEQSSAQAGDAKAQFAMASRYEDGRGVSRNMEIALDWYRKAAQGGLVPAQTYLGVIYDKGRGVKQNNLEAIRWYQMAADQGDAQAQYNLGVFHFQGRSIPADKAEARKLFERASSAGYEPATGALRQFY
jgi:TPR repeat protein